MSNPHSFDDAAGLERVTASLRRLPPADPHAADRIVGAALAEQRRARQRRTWVARAAVVALTVGVASGGVWYGRRSAGTGERHATVATRGAPSTAPVTTAPVAPPAAAPASHVADGGRVQFASAGAGEDAPVTVAFTLRHRDARRVALVGDFDEWSPTAVPMARAGGDVWTVTVSLAPGRHAYAFVVDDTVWVTDPQAPVVRDADYGRDQSVTIVGRP